MPGLARAVDEWEKSGETSHWKEGQGGSTVDLRFFPAAR